MTFSAACFNHAANAAELMKPLGAGISRIQL
jgi:hypothetical protein